MIEYFVAWKKSISKLLEKELIKKTDDFSRVQRLGPDALQRILDFTHGGKMLRGGLVCLAQQLCTEELDEETLLTAGAIELFQSALLIHDDIMDRDSLRRSKPSIYYQYKNLAEEIRIEESYHLGESLGICSGDLAFFLGFELLCQIASRNPQLLPLITLCSRELSYVGIAQMADVLRGATNTKPDHTSIFGGFLSDDDPEEAVLRVYRYKTGRYTFSLPLMMGAILGGAEESLVSALGELGEDLGILFQLKDDEIGIFGDEQITGKPKGSDIREGKKTLFYVYSLEQLKEREKLRFLQVFGDQDSEDQEIEELIGIIERNGIRDQVHKKCLDFAQSARSKIEALKTVNSQFQELLQNLVDYNLNREK